MSDTESDYSRVDDDFSKLKTSNHCSKAARRNATYLKNAGEPVAHVRIPFEQLRRALDVLNSSKTRRTRSGNRCRVNESCKYYAEKTSPHYLNLIKAAIVKHEWNAVPKLLIGYINEIKAHKSSLGILLRYALVLLLNDPTAKEKRFLVELFNNLLSCGNDAKLNRYLKEFMTIPKANAVFLKGGVIETIKKKTQPSSEL